MSAQRKFLGDGTEFEVLRSVRTIKDGIPSITVTIAPFDFTKRMLKIDDKELSHAEYAFGTLTRTYPLGRIAVLSENIEKPIWVGLCSFHGVPTKGLSEELDILVSRSEELIQTYRKIDLLEKAMAQVQRENLMYATRSKEFFETQQSLTQPKMMLPPDAGPGTEFEFKRKIEAGKG